MLLAVVSHKVCWKSKDPAISYLTDGGFPRQMEAISELFDETRLIVPCEIAKNIIGVSPLKGRNLSVIPLSVPKGQGIRRKLAMLQWVIANGPLIWKEVRRADAVHAPIPGDVGTIGMLCALLQRKPLFVRHCGNWLEPRTWAEKFWKWSMERFAGGRNVMLATGGSTEPPSSKNPKLKWIFSTSLRKNEIENMIPKRLPESGKINLIIVCRQEKRKGTEIVIDSLPLILRDFPDAVLDIVGGGALLASLKNQVRDKRLEDHVVFHGKVSPERVMELLEKAHIFCYPTSASEGFPKVVLEALASGLPVVTTRVSVLPDLIGGGGGILLDDLSALAISEAVRKIGTNKGDYSRMSARAIETAQQYSLENWRDTIGGTLREEWKVSSLSTIS